MGCTRKQIVEQAQSWLGRNEADGSFQVIIDTYNSHKPLAVGYKLKYTDEWCSGFASACAIACNATDIIPTEVGCGRHIDLFKKMGIWVENDDYIPSPGDYIFYDWKDDGLGENTNGASHIGIVEKVEDGWITVIEGNKAAAAGRRTIAVNGRYIRGYGVPKYDAQEDALPEVTYRVYVDGRWLPAVTGYNQVDSSGYAGVFGRKISGLQVRLSNGNSVTMRGHICGRLRINWLRAVTKWDNTANGYCGIKGKAMDCIALRADDCKIKYRVHILGSKWLPWVSGYDLSDCQQGFAGVYGRPIDAVQITVEK
ncbi:MAG: CHAP domain-containing protein [Oscillospiraceae bacterium]|nr:CHAP domain-containing protein [Oscillospiraceae bacterium]